MYKALIATERVLTRIVEAVLAVLFMAIFVMVFYQVVLRYLFSSSIFGTAELFTMFFAYASALGSAVMVRHREHIKISVFVDRLPRVWQKRILILDYVLIAAFSFFIVKESIPWLMSIRTFRSSVTGISRAVESITIPIAFGLIILYCFVNSLSILLDPEETKKELAATDAEAKHALDEAADADRRFRERTKAEGTNQ
jgi:TRAP-type C4-dicarboxylate transport system permease small subunit